MKPLNDAYFTSNPMVLYDSILQHIDVNDFLIVEPSVGNGSFIKLIFKLFQDKTNKTPTPNRLCLYDIQKYNTAGVITKIFNICFKQTNFLEVNNIDTPLPIIFIGNPPFGKNNSMAQIL